MAKNFVEQITIKAVADGFDRINQQIQSVEKSAEGLSRKLSSIGKALTISITAPLTAFAALAIKEFGEAEKAIAKVESGLKSTGKAAGLTFDQLDKAAKQLQNNSIFGDDQILGELTANLLTFTNVAGENFLKTQVAVVDLATKMDTDLKSATIQLGKALNDPVANLSALSRSGIQFSKDQQATIKSLVETNRLADAQVIILKELENQFGGTGEAVAKTFGGQLIQLKNAFGDLAEVIGGRLALVLQPFVQQLKTIFENLQQVSPRLLDLAIKFGAVAAAIGPLSIALSLFIGNLTLFFNPITIGIAALVALTSALDALAQRFTIVSRVINGVNTVLFAFLSFITKAAQSVVKLLSLLIQADSIIAKVLGLERISKFGEKISLTLDEVSKDIKEFSDNLAGVAGESLSKTISGETANVISVNDLFGDFNDFLKKINEKGTETGQVFGEGIKSGVTASNPFAVSAALAADKLDQELNRIRDQYNQLTETGQIFSNSFTTAFSNIASGAESLGQSFKNLGRNIINSIAGAAIRNAFTSLFQNLGGIFTQGGVFAGAPNVTGQTFATGGAVSGPGGPKSDSIPAWLSNGEYVINAKSASMLGLSLLNKLNNLGKGFSPKSRFGLPAFADGGSVSGGSGVSVNVINNSSQPVNARASTRFDGKQLIIDTFLEDARNNGPMSQNIQNLYGVRR